jgi:hypothetical protein
MFSIQFSNNYYQPISWANQSKSIAPNTTLDTGGVGGNQVFNLPGIGDIIVFDLGETKLTGYDMPGMNATWGVLIRFQTVEIYGRYEGGGSFNITVDAYGDAQVHPVNCTMAVIKLPGLSID